MTYSTFYPFLSTILSLTNSLNTPTIKAYASTIIIPNIGILHKLPPKPQQPQNYCLSLSLPIIEYHINEIIQYVAFELGLSIRVLM